MPLFYRLGQNPFTDPDDLWIHYGYHEGVVAWFDWDFDLTDWTVDDRRRVVSDKYGSPMKTYIDIRHSDKPCVSTALQPGAPGGMLPVGATLPATTISLV